MVHFRFSNLPPNPRVYVIFVDQAERAFEAARNLEPFRLWDMEVYSTLLWHLRRNVRLSFLAQELLSTDPKAPQAWIAVGNCFSLQKEKTQALTCFRRAAQLDPTCAYAYTLSGHESIDDDLNKAINFFQSALRADARHYNAWCVEPPFPSLCFPLPISSVCPRGTCMVGVDDRALTTVIVSCGLRVDSRTRVPYL